MLRQRHTEKKTNEKKPSFKVVPAKRKRKFSKLFFVAFTGLIVILYVVVPLAFYLCPSIRHHAVFLHYASFSRNKNLSFPEEMGLKCAKNFYVQSDGGIKLGTWYIPPAEAKLFCEKSVFKPGEEFSDTRPVFLYLHGNVGSRGSGHRVSLYNVLSQKVNAHVIAFDYRGYGDSTNIRPSQEGVVNDSLRVYYWLRKHVNAKRIYVWGHSLGTGIAAATVEKLQQNKEVPAGLILEAPFTKLADVVKYHPLSLLHRYMPFFDFFFVNPIAAETSLFNTITKIGQVKPPVLILHAEDDGVIPYHHGKQLHEQRLADRSGEVYQTQFVRYDGKLAYGHKYICNDPDLPNIIKQFIKKHK